MIISYPFIYYRYLYIYNIVNNELPIYSIYLKYVVKLVAICIFKKKNS